MLLVKMKAFDGTQAANGWMIHLYADQNNTNGITIEPFIYSFTAFTF